METVDRNQICREPGEGGSLVKVISMEDHSGVSFLKLNYPVTFPDNKKLMYIFGLSCLSKEEISETLNDLVTLAENDEFFSELERKNNQAEIHKTIKKYIERKI